MQSTQHRSRWLLVSALSALPLVFCSWARAADEPITIENIRVGYQGGLREGQFKVGAWTPVWVDLQAGPERFQGILEVEVPDDDGTPTLVRRVIDVPKKETVHDIVLYVRPGSRNAEVNVRVRDARGRLRARKEPPSTAWIESTQMLVLTMGSTRGVDEVPTLPAFTSPNPSNPTDLMVSAVRVPEGIAARAEGFDGVEAVVIDTNNQDLMDALNAGKGQALKDWVRDGGHLVVAVGGNWQQVRDSMLKTMLPALPSGTLELRETSAGNLETFADSKKNLRTPIRVAKLDEPNPNRHPHTLASTTQTPLVVRGSYGFGRVTVVGLDVDQKPFSDWEDKKLFWV
jgi:hypothetical protein